MLYKVQNMVTVLVAWLAVQTAGPSHQPRCKKAQQQGRYQEGYEKQVGEYHIHHEASGQRQELVRRSRPTGHHHQ